MVQYQIKLRPCISQENQYNQWLLHLTSVYKCDRDVNSARNTLNAAAGYVVEVAYAQ